MAKPPKSAAAMLNSHPHNRHGGSALPTGCHCCSMLHRAANAAGPGGQRGRADSLRAQDAPRGASTCRNPAALRDDVGPSGPPPPNHRDLPPPSEAPHARGYPRGESLLSARAPPTGRFLQARRTRAQPHARTCPRFLRSAARGSFCRAFSRPLSAGAGRAGGAGGPASRRSSSRRSPGGAAAAGARRSAPRAVGAPRGRPVGPRGGGAGGGGGAEATSGRPRGARAGDGGGGTGVEAAALRRKRRRRRRRRDAGGGRGAAVVELLRAGGGGRRPEGCRGSGRWVCGRAGREVGREPRRREGSAARSCRGAARKLRGAAMWGFGGVRESDGAPCPRPGASQGFM